MALKRRKRRKIAVMLLSIIVIVLVGTAVFFATRATVEYRETKDRVEINEIHDRNRYKIKIDYPKTEYKSLNKKIEKYVEGEKKDFLSNIKGKDTPTDASYFDLNVNYSLTSYKDIIFVHICSYQFTGGANYERKDETLIYNTRENKYMNIYDMLSSKGMLKDFSVIAKQYVEEYYKHNNMEYNSEMIRMGTEPTEENYRNVYIKDDGIQVVFPPYQVGARADGEIAVTIPFDELLGIVQEKYLDEKVIKNVKARKALERDITVFNGKPVLAFSFDDGPNNATTMKLVDEIEKYDGRATFFVLGSRISNNSEALKYAYEKGNQIGSHTYNHLNLTKLDEAALKNEIFNTDEEIGKITGTKPRIIRPPYGITNDEVKHVGDKATILWSIDTRDWASRDKDAIAKEIVTKAEDGDIILMHDIYESSVEGCALAMKELYDKGYRFVTIDEMARLKGKKLTGNGTYYSFEN